MVDDRYFKLGKDGLSVWTDKPLHSKFSRTCSSNVVIHLPGPTADAKGVKDEEKLFSLYINDQIVDKIVLHTISEIVKSKLKYAVHQCSFINQTDKTEIKAFIGLLFMSGVLKNTGLCLDDTFSESYGPSIFRCIISRRRFAFYSKTSGLTIKIPVTNENLVKNLLHSE